MKENKLRQTKGYKLGYFEGSKDKEIEHLNQTPNAYFIMFIIGFIICLVFSGSLLIIYYAWSVDGKTIHVPEEILNNICKGELNETFIFEDIQDDLIVCTQIIDDTKIIKYNRYLGYT